MGAKISLIGQITEVEREIRMRERVYPQQISAGKMKQEEAQMLMDRMHAVRASLLFLKEHKTEFRAWHEQRKQSSRGQA